MNVVFRADASSTIGTGHVMRCLTLAGALRARGAQIMFVSREHDGHLCDAVEDSGFSVTRLTPRPTTHTGKYSQWLGASWQEDADETAAALAASSLRPEWLVVDHYAIDCRWEQEMRARAHRTMVIDDLADRQHDCDILLDQNLGRTAACYASRVPSGCIVLAGTAYALLRPEFAALRQGSLDRRTGGPIERLLISMGGVDKDNTTGRVLDALCGARLPARCRVQVVLGAAAPWADALRTRAATLPWPTEVVVGTREMGRLMADSDLSIGAAGSTSWERCCLGLPSIVVALAANQVPSGQRLSDAGAAALIEAPSIEAMLAGEIERLIASPAALLEMSRAARRLVDGLGAGRVVEQMAQCAA